MEAYSDDERNDAQRAVAVMRSVHRWLSAKPVRATVVLAGCFFVTYVCYRIGAVLLEPTANLTEGQRSLVGRYVAWPGGMYLAFLFGSVILALLLVPDGRFDGRWRWRVTVLAWWSTLTFALLQFLDDHLLNQAGTSNPLHLEIPAQDFLEVPVLAALAAAFAFAVCSIPFRVVARRKVAA